ncbi:MAG: GNAT family N-acetyltransferase [Bacteroidia bacterium]|nr:GNAT family N-acetyltransferase [Bacteroidia bacterium]
MLNTLLSPINKALLAKELKQCRKLKKCTRGHNELYVFTAYEAPNILLEIARLRELTFREAGGGTGLPFDMDEFDIGDHPYSQLFLWDPRAKEIVGGYRFCKMRNSLTKDGEPQLSTAELFSFSKKFMCDYFSNTLELGRSWIQPTHQFREGNRKGIFSLENLWEGVGALLANEPDIHFLFGKVSVLTSYHAQARDLLLSFLQYYFYDEELLVRPRQSFLLRPHPFAGMDFENAYKLLREELKNYGERIPPLIQSYMHLSEGMKIFGSCIDPSFGNSAETGLLITVANIYEEKKQRYFGPLQFFKAA